MHPPPGRLADASTGSLYSAEICAQLFDTGANLETWRISGGSLPPGLYLREVGRVCSVGMTTSAEITGVPTVGGLFSFQVTCEVGLCTPMSQAYSIYVVPGCTITPIGLLPDATAYEPYQAVVAMTGGAAPYRYRLASGLLPPGLTLSSWGTIQGVPAFTGTYGFVIEVIDATSCGVNIPFSIQVDCPQGQLFPATLAPGAMGHGYDQQLTVLDGSPTQVFRHESGALPTGLSLTYSGRITGTALNKGASTFAVATSDPSGCTARHDYELEVLGRESPLAGMGAGGGNPNRVRILDPAGATAVDLAAYGAGAWGAEVASGRLDPGFYDTVLTGPGPGPSLGPHVRGFDRTGAARPRISFFAYGTLLWGVAPAASDVDGDLIAEIETGPGPGGVFGPHVRGFDADSGPVTALTGLNFFAYQTLRYGVRVAGGDLDGDARSEIVTGPGPGGMFGPSVRGWRFAPPVQAMSGVTFDAFAGARFGSRVAAGEVDGDPFDDILVGRGAGVSEPGQVRGFEVDGGSVSWLAGFDAVVTSGVYGVSVGNGDLSRDGRDDLIAGAGPDPGADSWAYWLSYTGSGLTPPVGFAEVFPGAGYGVNPTSGHFDY